ncbi:MAG: hypothetical protein ACKVJX_16325 [Verrucomicrobiia bacterium]|jgi:ABC-type transport system involved in cytochrome c biogenesis permease component
MTFLPVVHRELQIAARQRRTHWIRVSAPVIAFGVLFVMAGTSINWQDKDRVGHDSFEMIAGLTMAYCLLVGMWATSDCLSRERREGTLGLLFLTDLSGADVVLGKLAASSTRMFNALIAVFPILGVPSITLLLLGSMAFLIIETETVARVSLWQGLTVSNPNRASGYAFFSGVALPCIFFLTIFLFAAMLGAAMTMGIVLWWFVGIFVNSFFREKAEEGLTARITQLETI